MTRSSIRETRSDAFGVLGDLEPKRDQAGKRFIQFLGVLFEPDQRDLAKRLVLVILLYTTVVLTREALHSILPGVRYVMFFPALLVSGLLCGAYPSIVLLLAFSITGGLWAAWEETSTSLVAQLALTLLFVLAGAAIIFPCVYSVNAYRRITEHRAQLELINNELRHRLGNVFALVSSICTQTLLQDFPREELSRDIAGRIRAVAQAQGLLSITSQKRLELHELVMAIAGPICPNRARLSTNGEFATIPSDLATSLALILHELSTNAIKHGAWRSDCQGSVAITWGLEQDRLWFRWNECGAEIKTIPARRGFGSKLFQEAFNGLTIEHKLDSEGAECSVVVSHLR